jgi:hypothetical protein
VCGEIKDEDSLGCSLIKAGFSFRDCEVLTIVGDLEVMVFHEV